MLRWKGLTSINMTDSDICPFFFAAGMASIQPHQLPPAGFIQQPFVHQNVLPGGYNNPHQSILQGEPNGSLNRVEKSGRSRKSVSEDEGSSDHERTQDDGDQENGRRWQSLEDRSGGSSENDGGLEDDRKERKKKQKKESQNEKPQDNSSTPAASKLKKNKIQKKGSSSSDGSNQSETKSVKFIQPEVYQTLTVPGQNGAGVSPPTPIPSGRVISSPFPGQEAEQVIAHSRNVDFTDIHASKDNPSGKIDEKGAADLNRKKKPADSKGEKKKRRDRSRSPSVERTQSKEQNGQKEDSRYVIYEVTNDSAVYGEVTMSRVDTPPSLSEVEERSKFVQFPSPAKGARRPTLPDELEHDNAIANGLQDLNA